MTDGTLETFRGYPITYLNFSGKATDFNVAGNRNFHVVLPEDRAAALIANNWNVKFHEPKNDETPGFHSLQVKVQYDGYKPPFVTMITSKGPRVLNGDSIGALDSLDIAKIDLTIRAYDHNSGMGTGRSAYLKTAFVTIDEDELMREYGVNIGASDDSAESPI